MIKVVEKLIKKQKIYKLSGNSRATLKKKNRNYLIKSVLRFFLVLKAGLEPARTLLFTGF